MPAWDPACRPEPGHWAYESVLYRLCIQILNWTHPGLLFILADSSNIQGEQP